MADIRINNLDLRSIGNSPIVGGMVELGGTQAGISEKTINFDFSLTIEGKGRL